MYYEAHMMIMMICHMYMCMFMLMYMGMYMNMTCACRSYHCFMTIFVSAAIGR